MEHESNAINNVLYLTEPKKSFEDIYARIREKEERWLTDDIVKMLPKVPIEHPHYNEWKKRIFSLERIIKILENSDSIKILEVGCGNGWFANTLVELEFEVDAVDVGKQELEQAARCFQHESLKFICCDDLSLLENSAYDIIIFNASLHYFDTTKKFWKILYDKLRANGKIFIMDSKIYSENEVSSAQLRTENYFNQLNEPEAAKYYRHLTWNKLPKHQILYSPRKIGRLLNKHQSPFPMIQINKDS